MKKDEMLKSILTRRNAREKRNKKTNKKNGTKKKSKALIKNQLEITR